MCENFNVKYIAIIFYFLGGYNFPQSLIVNKIEPPNWWANMKYDKVQFMLYGNDLYNLSVLNDLSELRVDKIYNADNSNYCFIDAQIPNVDVDTSYKIFLANSIDTTMFEIPVLVRLNCKDCYKGFTCKDIIYLITPDRFCNGDTSNDIEKSFVPDYPFGSEQGRHGGDIKGIIQNLDYIKETGFTAIWINPLLENNSVMSYHGYAATDLYKIDPRFGTNELYKELVAKAHEKRLKVIFDHINNHIGINHPWVNNPPFENWFNGTKENHFITPHEKISIYSSYSNELTKDSTTDGWFVEEMPDLNQRNPFLAKYLIQNMIWWIEFTGLDGIREDTYPYSDQKFLSEWNSIILAEYPEFNITGEIWIEEPAFLAQYQKDSKLNKNINTNLPSIIDFGLYNAIRKFCSPTGSVRNLYETLARDFLYSNPKNLFTFVDNHDTERIMHFVDNNLSLLKLALTFLLTTRGIPQIYYGTEIGMVGGKSHGEIREEFLGGFPKHKRNAFIEDERTELENQIYSFVKNLITIRKNHSSLQNGRLIHFPPQNELYIYFRTDDSEKTAIVINNNSIENVVDFDLYKKILGKNPEIKSILLGVDNIQISEKLIKIKSKASSIILIK